MSISGHLPETTIGDREWRSPIVEVRSINRRYA